MSQTQNVMQQNQINTAGKRWPLTPMFGIPLAIILFLYGAHQADMRSTDQTVKAVEMTKVDLPEATPNMEKNRLANVLAYNREVLAQRGLKAGEIRFFLWDGKDGDAIIIHGGRSQRAPLEFHRYQYGNILPQNGVAGTIKIVADSPVRKRVSFVIMDETGTKFWLRLRHGETLAVTVRKAA